MLREVVLSFIADYFIIISSVLSGFFTCGRLVVTKW